MVEEEEEVGEEEEEEGEEVELSKEVEGTAEDHVEAIAALDGDIVGVAMPFSLSSSTSSGWPRSFPLPSCSTSSGWPLGATIENSWKGDRGRWLNRSYGLQKLSPLPRCIDHGLIRPCHYTVY